MVNNLQNGFLGILVQSRQAVLDFLPDVSLVSRTASKSMPQVEVQDAGPSSIRLSKSNACS